MNEYIIKVENGKVIGDSAFFSVANDLLRNESKRLCELTDNLDDEPTVKKEKIAEYKCAKYRYATVSFIHAAIFNNNQSRKLYNLEYSHYLLQPYDEIFKRNGEYLDLYEAAPVNEKPDYSLYYSMLALAETEIAKLNGKMQNATDWEKIELDERLGGLEYAKECLNEAWTRRKEVIK